MAHYYLGPVTGAVFGALLKSLENTVVETKIKPQTVKPETAKAEDDSEDEEDMLPSVTDAEVLEHLGKSIDLAAGVKVPRSASNLPNGVSKRKVLSDDPDEAELGIKVEKDSDDEAEDPPANGYRTMKERNKRLSLVGMHLNILAEHPIRFFKRSWDSKSSRIDISALNNKLVREEIDTMIGNRYSNIETRIVRCLRERGKLEEKQLQAMTMMRQQPLRIHLTFLQFAGICDSQELPKDASRQPNRVLHLWQFNEKRVVNDYLHRAYRGMSRSLQRLRVEREGKFRAVIEKADRADVKGREQELLNLQERNLLKEWREVEERVLVQVDRLDDLVGVLRDFPGNNHALMI
jgi:DNA-directed RNA polymerase III subunit RPC3